MFKLFAWWKAPLSSMSILNPCLFCSAVYTEEEAKLWEETFTEFSYEIRRLALKYPADVVKKKMATIDQLKKTLGK
jgi:hypothetical protein